MPATRAPLLFAIVLSAGWFAAGTAEGGSEPGSPLDYNLAFARRQPGSLDRPVASPDGSRVAYTVIVRPDRTPQQGLADTARYLPNGTPLYAIGSRLYVADVGGGRSVAVGPDGANSWRPAWSPDGSRLAFYCDDGGPPRLWVHKMATGQARRVGDAVIRGSIFPGDEPNWSPDGREVYVRLRAARRETPRPEARAPTASNAGPTVTVYRAGREEQRLRDTPKPSGSAEYIRVEAVADLGAVEVASGAVRVVVPADEEQPPGYLRLSPSGKWLAYLTAPRRPSPTAFAYRCTLVVLSAGGAAGPVVREEMDLPDDYFVGGYRWHPSRDVLVYATGGGLHLVDLAAERSRPLGQGLGAVEPYPLAYTRDGTRIVTRVRPAKGPGSQPGPATFAVIPLDGGEPSTVTPADGTPVAILTATRQTLWQPEPDALTAVFQAPDGGQVVARVDLATGRTTKTLRREPGSLTFYGGGAGHEAVVALRQGPATPPDYYVFDAAVSNPRRLSTAEPRLDAVRIGPVEFFETQVPLYDGTRGRARAAVLLPAGAKRGDRLPTVVSVYAGAHQSGAALSFGGGNVATIPAAVFTTRGYAVLLPDLPIGPPGAGRDPIREATDVLLPQVYRAAELGYTDVGRVAVVGQSYGGYSAAGVVTHTNLFRAAVAVNGTYDLPGQYAAMDSANTGFHVAWSEAGQARMGTHPWGDLRRYLANSPYYLADKIHTPLLLVHGEKDDDTPDGRKMFNALKRLGKTAQLAVYAGEGHTVFEWSTANAADAARRAVEFLDAHVRGPAADGNRTSSSPPP